MVPANEAIEGAEEIEFAAGCEATTIRPTIHPERMEQEVALPHEINLSARNLLLASHPPLPLQAFYCGRFCTCGFLSNKTFAIFYSLRLRSASTAEGRARAT